MATLNLQGDNTKTFAYIIQHMSLFSDYLKLQVSNDAFTIRCFNESRTSIADVKLSMNTWFTNCVCEQDVDMFVSSSILYKMLNVLDPTKEVELQIMDTGMVIQGYNTNSKITYNLNALVLEIEDIDVPDQLDFMVDVTLPIKTFCNTIDNMMIVGEECVVKCSEDMMSCTSNGDNGSININILVDELEEYAIEEGLSIAQCYQLKLLHIIASFHKLGDNIYLKMSSDKPLLLLYNLDTSGTSFVRFLVAPKIMDD